MGEDERGKIRGALLHRAVRAADLIQELFDGPRGSNVEIRWDSATTLQAYFNSGEHRYGVFITPVTEGHFTVAFYLCDADDNPSNFGYAQNGQQFTVMPTVLDLVKGWVEKWKPATLSFSSKGDSRTALYRRMLSRFAAQLGYAFDEEPGATSQMFTMRRKASSQQGASGNLLRTRQG